MESKTMCSANNAVTKQFILAGRAIFTLEIPESYRESLRFTVLKPHYTFRVKYKPAKGEYKENYFFQILTGPNNTADYTYFGILDKDSGFVRMTAKSSYSQSALLTKLVNRILELIWKGDISSVLEQGFHLHHEGRCARCSRPLTTPESVARGWGPECWGKVA